MADILDIEYTPEDIGEKRSEIAREMTAISPSIKSSCVNSISEADLRLLYELYDSIFLKGWFASNFMGRMKFSLSKRMTKSAGLTLCPKNAAKIKPEELTIEIRIGVNLIFQYGAVGGSKLVCGIRTNNSLEALLLVFEHELCHAIEFILFKKSSCRGKRFRSIAGRLFGHTERYHALPTARQIAGQKLYKKVGDAVTFNYKGMKLSGFIYSINKRAAVMVRDKSGRYADRQGNLYNKYYVPVALLEK